MTSRFDVVNPRGGTGLIKDPKVMTYPVLTIFTTVIYLVRTIFIRIMLTLFLMDHLSKL